MARRKKKKLSLLGKVKSHLVNAKNWMVDHAHDDEFLPALLWLGGGFMLVFGCLNPWLVLGLAGVLTGAKKLWDIARW